MRSPTAGDRGDRQVRDGLEREISGRRRPRRRLRLPFSSRSVALVPAVLLVTGAASAAAWTLAVLHADPTALFQKNSGSASPGVRLPRHQTVIPSTVRMIDTFQVPDVGAVQYWVGDTSQHGLCQAMRRPDGAWAAYSELHTTAGQMPGCQATRQQTVAGMTAAQGGKLRVGLLPMSVDEQYVAIKGSNGRWWDIYYGIVSADGAAGVKDPANGQTAPLIDGRYFVLIARRTGNCDGCDNLRAVNAAGEILPADYGPVQDRDH
ncbi:MAG: hypothetical protein ACRDPA_13525, partial [Solirubrobacteraceae bacterium]